MSERIKSELEDSLDTTNPQQDSLQAILRWSIQQQDAAGPGSDSAHSDEKNGASAERKKWLHEALSALSQQPSETDLLKAALAVLNAHAPSLNTSSADRKSEEEEKVLEALEQAQYLVEDLDHARDLIPLQGVGVITSYLQHPNVEICTEICHLIATATQNNPVCQSAFLITLPRLLSLIHSSSSPAALRTKALYALSCLTREYSAGLRELIKSGGLEVLLGCLESGIDRLVLKALFLLCAYYSSDEAKSSVTPYAVTVTTRLISLLSPPNTPSDPEAFTQALCTLSAVMSCSNDAVLECNKTEHGLRSLFDQWIHANKDEDILEALRNAQRLCFSSQ